MSLQSQDIIRRSATNSLTPAPQVRVLLLDRLLSSPDQHSAYNHLYELTIPVCRSLQLQRNASLSMILLLGQLGYRKHRVFLFTGALKVLQ